MGAEEGCEDEASLPLYFTDEASLSLYFTTLPAVISTRFDSDFERLAPERDAILTFYASREQPLLSPNLDFFRASTEAGQRAARHLTDFTGSLALREAGLISRFSL